MDTKYSIFVGFIFEKWGQNHFLKALNVYFYSKIAAVVATLPTQAKYGWRNSSDFLASLFIMFLFIQGKPQHDKNSWHWQCLAR